MVELLHETGGRLDDALLLQDIVPLHFDRGWQRSDFEPADSARHQSAQLSVASAVRTGRQIRRTQVEFQSLFAAATHIAYPTVTRTCATQRCAAQQACLRTRALQMNGSGA
jgi:hypothetical protein